MRLDHVLVDFLNIESRNKAQDLIKANQVTYKNKIVNKPSFDVNEADVQHVQILKTDILKFVSRAGLKLQSAIGQFKISFENKIVLDLGQSTGGFTDCALQNKARQVVGVDVGEGQLHQNLKVHPQVIYFEKLNSKLLPEHSDFLKTVPTGGFDVIIGDLSFISITKALVGLNHFLKKNGEFLFLVKPQFECSAQDLDKNGIVKNSVTYLQVETKIKAYFLENWGQVVDYKKSEVLGKDGNQEFFIYGIKANDSKKN